ncbi:hypothetical protein DL96DRAFT_1684374 [Flagelloscypha sp. PMI_526]|nr:hypothetical protein DL96DRAFT_1684374 [Flagelloscypha sp. PMI_526]
MSCSSSSRGYPNRKSNEKSKKGCLTCKTRHVKCDEMQTCSRRREPCVWKENLPDDPLSALLPRAAKAALKVSTDHQLSCPPLSEFRPKELELLHNWTTNTILTFIPDLPATRYGFQVLLPQLAFQNDFLLHATFAITSLHMNHLLPSSDYLPLAKMHCQRAVLGVFNAPMDSVSPDAVLMTNILLATYWLASPSWGSNHESYLPDVFNWIPAARTFMRRIGFYYQDLLEGTVSEPSFLPLAVLGKDVPVLAPFPSIFYQIYHPEDSPFDKDELKDAHILAAYDIALRRVSTCSWAASIDSSIRSMVMYAFLSTVPDIFITLFLEQRPRALILVAHYCAILGQLDGAWWYTWERCEHDLQRILSLLDEKWLPCMEYPLTLLAVKGQNLNGALHDLAGSSLVPEGSNEASRSFSHSFTEHAS